MLGVLLDASVLIKWFHEEREPELAEARAILRAHYEGALWVNFLDLSIYELGNFFLRLPWRPGDAADQLEELIQLCGAPITLDPAWRRSAAELGAAHNLTYYDAAYAAAARGLGIPLITADKLLLASGLAESATDFCQRLRLPLA